MYWLVRSIELTPNQFNLKHNLNYIFLKLGITWKLVVNYFLTFLTQMCLLLIKKERKKRKRTWNNLSLITWVSWEVISAWHVPFSISHIRVRIYYYWWKKISNIYVQKTIYYLTLKNLYNMLPFVSPSDFFNQRGGIHLKNFVAFN